MLKEDKKIKEFKPVTPQVDFPALEKEILTYGFSSDI